MKRLLLIALLLLSSQALFAQWNLDGYLGIALNRVDQAFRSGSPNSISDMLGSPITMRLGDSLYTDIAGMQASRLLNDFFRDKQIVSFTTGLPGSGALIFTEGGKTDTMRVDVGLHRAVGGPDIRWLNISNYPMATMFFDLRRDKDTSR